MHKYFFVSRRAAESRRRGRKDDFCKRSNASLFPVNANAETEKQYPLTGIFKNQQSQLSGKMDRYILCNNTGVESDRNKLVTIQMQQVDQGKITGQLTVNGIFSSLGFTAML